MRKSALFIAIFPLLFILFSCKSKHPPPQQKIVKDVRQLDEVIREQLQDNLIYLQENGARLPDSTTAFNPHLLTQLYAEHHYAAQWASNAHFHPVADSLLQVLRAADHWGLFPNAYHVQALQRLFERLGRDTVARKDAVLWTHADLLLTDACLKLMQHLHYGITPRDSLSLQKDSTFADSTFQSFFAKLHSSQQLRSLLASLEPIHPQYHLLKTALEVYRQQHAGQQWDLLPLTSTDTLLLQSQLRKRLLQGGYLDSADLSTAAVTRALKAFQREYHLYPDGKLGKKTLLALNRSPEDWMMQIRLNLERWRKMPDTLPHKYILVNIPAYRMELWENDSLRLVSKVIVGAPQTRTPVLNSVMTNFVLYPYWRVPFSIVVKEMLPAIQKDISYLARHQLEVIDSKGRTVDPYRLNWKMFNKHYFPYVLRQVEGVENSLGILKFNFRNKYNVYLHDTNNRQLFVNAYRALSHGCVRVQQWDQLAFYLIREDTIHHLTDSVRVWLNQKEKKQVNLLHRIPIYIRYFTTEVQNGRLLFYEDIYGEDEALQVQLLSAIGAS